jgi:polyisoprenoid-binding protein YceI
VTVPSRRRFTIDPTRSRLVIKARSTLHPISFSAAVTGHIEATQVTGGFDLSAPTSGLIRVNLIDLRSGESRNDAELRHRLEISRHPTATATIRGVRFVAADRYHLDGDLTLYGRDRPFVTEAVVTAEVDAIRASGAIEIDVRDFGISPPRLLVVRVHPEVRIELTLIATLANASSSK